MANKPTLKSLAAELGLSITTVSRALANYPDVSPKTREQVRIAAERVGYVPDQSARRLVTGRTNTVGVVLPFPSDEFHDPYVNDPFVNEILRHSAHALQRLPDMDLIVSYAHSSQDTLNIYKRFVQGRRVDGFFITRTQVHDQRVEYLLEQGVPFVTHGRTQSADKHAWVDTDARQGFANTTQRFIALGHQRIVLLNLPAPYFTAQLRAQGYTAAMESAGLESRVINCELRMQSGFETAMNSLRGPNPPTAFLCATDIIGVGAMQAIREAKLSPGQEVSVVGTDNLPLARLLEPNLASMTYSYQHVGHVMVDMLERQLGERRIVPQHELIDFALIERGSLGPCNSA